MPLMATFDPSGVSRQLPFRRGAMIVAYSVSYVTEGSVPFLTHTL